MLKIETRLCKGCGICVAFCPKQCLKLDEMGKVYQSDDSCISCGLCEMRCPDFAIEVVKEGAGT